MKYTTNLQSVILFFYFSFITIAPAQFKGTDSSYFPLKIGNQWSFVIDGGINKPKEKQKLVDTSSLNGHLYYIKNVNGPDPVYYFMVSYTQWYRLSNDTVFVIFINHSSNDSIEYPIYNLNAKIGDTLKTSSNWFGTKIILVSKDDTVSTLSGEYYHCYHFKHIEGPAAGFRTDSWLARGVGIVKFKEFWKGNITYELDSSSLITSIKETNIKLNTFSYLSLESYPNPFNPKTTLSYQINSNGNVLLEIFDVLGRKVDQLVNERKESGSYNVIWNGEKMPSGLYFAVLRSNNFSVTKKLILQK